MNRRNFLRNVAYSAGLVALSACTLRIENPLKPKPREVFSVFSHTPAIEPGEYRAGTWDAMRDYCAKDVELTEKLRGLMGSQTIMAIDPGYRTAQEQHSIRGRADQRVRGLHQYHGATTGRWTGREPAWAPAYAVAGEIKSLGQRVEHGYMEMDLSATEARVHAYYEAAKDEALTGKRQDFPLTGKRQNFYGSET